MRFDSSALVLLTVLFGCGSDLPASFVPGTDVALDSIDGGEIGFDTDQTDLGSDVATDGQLDAGRCPEGEELVDGICQDVDECAEQPELCGPPELAECVNRQGAPPLCECDSSGPRTGLLDGIAAFDTEGALPSTLVVHGRGAFPVIVDSGNRVMAAGAIYGEGKVFTIAHEGLMQRTGDNPLAALVLNVAAWMAAPTATNVVGVAPGLEGAASNLGFAGYTVTTIEADALQGVDVFVTTNYTEYSGEDLEAIRLFVAAGGGLITGGHAWWWGRDRDDEVENFPGNHTLRPFGIVVTGSTANDGAYDLTSNPAADMHHAACALDALVEDRASAGLSADARAIAALAAGQAVTALPIDSPYFEDAARFAEDIGPIIPTAEAPITPTTQAVEALALRVQVRFALDAPADRVEAHPAGDDFPGPVNAGAERVTASLTVDGDYAGYPTAFAFSGAEAPVWRSTGLYAAPGDTITVRIDERFTRAGVGVRIGAHSDELWGLEEWHRVPQLTRHQVLEAPVTEIANGFGGPIYITVRWGASLGPIGVEIEGGVAAALHQLGEDGDEWPTQIDAPWVEFPAGGIIFSLPLEAAQGIDDVGRLGEFWRDVMAGAGDLSGFEAGRERPERIVLDRQISAGWMHSGYPIMGHLESTREVTTVADLTTIGAWGPFHELGHNHQWIDWVLPGTTETGCNLWSVYISEEVAGVSRDDAHEAIAPVARAGRIADWQLNPDFANWSVWMALETYLQLEEEFGWELLTTLFQEYRAIPEVSRPGDDNARIQEWVARSSRAAGMDLTDFYDAWAFPISDATRTAVEDLPMWTSHPMAE
jgi:hypothetical protein